MSIFYFKQCQKCLMLAKLCFGSAMCVANYLATVKIKHSIIFRPTSLTAWVFVTFVCIPRTPHILCMDDIMMNNWKMVFKPQNWLVSMFWPEKLREVQIQKHFETEWATLCISRVRNYTKDSHFKFLLSFISCYWKLTATTA